MIQDIKVGGIYERFSDGIYRQVLRIIDDPRHAEGKRVEFSYWNPATKNHVPEEASCGIKSFQEFSIREVDFK